MLDPADLPPDDILDYVAIDTDNAGQLRIRVVEGKKHLRAVQEYLTRLRARYQGRVGDFEFTTLDVIARIREATTIAGQENGMNPVQNKMLGYIRHAATLNASDLHITPGRDNTDFTYVEARVHGELEILDIIRKDEGVELLGATYSGMTDVIKGTQFDPGVPQDARLAEKFLKLAGLFGARYSHYPCVGGLYAVLRLIKDDSSHIPTFGMLGYHPKQEQTIRRILQRPEGIITLSGPTGSGKSTTLRTAFGLKRAEFYESLGGMIRDGTPSLRALEFICNVETDFGTRKGTSGMYFLARECIASLKASGMLSGALPTWVPPEEAALIRNGEERGNIAEALFQVAKTVKARREMVSSLITLCLYPLLLLSLCVVNMYNAHTRIIPIVSAFAPEEKWSFQMKVLAAMSELVIGYGLWLSGAIITLVIIIRFSLSRYTGPGRRLLDKLPPWSLYQTFHGVNYLFSISSMLQINIPLSQALLRTEKSAEHNKWLKERIQAIRKNVLSGQNLATAMRNSDYDFPSKICINKLLLNSEREDSVSAMNTYAGQWLEDAKKSVRKSGLIITGISGGFVFFFILNMISAIYSISDMLKQ